MSTRWPWYVAAVGCIVDVLVDVRVQFTAVMTDAVPSLLLYSLDDGYSTPLSPILGVRTSGTYVRSTYRYVFSTYVPPPTYVVQQYRMVPREEKKIIPRNVRTYVGVY